MTRFRFIHAADLHLDTPFEGIARVAPHVAEKLRDASLEAWDGLVRLAIEREVAFVLLAGDIYDGADRGVRAQLRFCAGLQLLSDQGIQVFIVHGNHDPLDGWSAIRTWPAGVTVFDAAAVESALVQRDGERLATIHGISYPRRDVSENLSLRFSRGSDAGFNIGLLHCNVGANPDHASYSPCSVDDLMRARMDYWALGHVHRQSITEQDGTFIVYPGTLQGRSARSFDQGEKGAFLVEVDDQGRPSLEFMALDRIRFIVFELDVTTVEDLPALQRALTERASQFRRLHAGKGLILRAMLTGRSDVHRDLLRTNAMDDLLRVLRHDADLERPFLWWDNILDHSSLSVDLDVIRARGDFSAELLGAADRLLGEEGRLDQLVQEQFDPLARAGVQRWLGDPDLHEGPALLKEAAKLAVELLEDEQVDR